MLVAVSVLAAATAVAASGQPLSAVTVEVCGMSMTIPTEWHLEDRPMGFPSEVLCSATIRPRAGPPPEFAQLDCREEYTVTVEALPGGLVETAHLTPFECDESDGWVAASLGAEQAEQFTQGGLVGLRSRLLSKRWGMDKTQPGEFIWNDIALVEVANLTVVLYAGVCVPDGVFDALLDSLHSSRAEEGR